jgi:hypothetical protein
VRHVERIAPTRIENRASDGRRVELTAPAVADRAPGRSGGQSISWLPGTADTRFNIVETPSHLNQGAPGAPR